jgi:MarR family transcriptional regulator, negative regulator of the multidrug operon emrRAB
MGYHLEISISSQDTNSAYIAKIKRELKKINVSRIVAFADVFNRYIILRAQDEGSLFRANAVASIITRGGRITPSHLANLLLRSRNSISKLLEGLEEQGLVRRYHPKGNNRTVYVEVTMLGLQWTIENLKSLVTLDEEIQSILDEKEIQTLVVLSRKLRLGLVKKLANNNGRLSRQKSLS